MRSACTIAQGETLPILVYLGFEQIESQCIVSAGLAVKEFWEVDDSTIVFVADPTFGGILNFNVGANVDLQVPRVRFSLQRTVNMLLLGFTMYVPVLIFSYNELYCALY